MVPGRRCLIANGVVIDPGRLREEVAGLEALGLDVVTRLGVSPVAHVILPYHQAVEASAEQGPGAIGTTGRGIGFAYRDKAPRTGVRIADLFERETFVARVDRNLARLAREFPEATALQSMSGAALHDGLRETLTWLQPMVCDVSAELHAALGHHRRVLLEIGRAHV